jgi:hypothetical protein
LNTSVTLSFPFPYLFSPPHINSSHIAFTGLCRAPEFPKSQLYLLLAMLMQD